MQFVLVAVAKHCLLHLKAANPLNSYPSRMDSRQQYKLSNFCLVTESLTFMAGTHSFPALDNWYKLEKKKRKKKTHLCE